MGWQLSHARGRWGEDTAAQYLQAQGYTIIDTRVRVDRRSEIDLVARKGELIAFVEVKTRSSVALGRPAAAVGRSKRDALSRAAVRYLKSHRVSKVYFRFDIVEVIGEEESPVIRHIPNAFPLSPRYRYP